MKPIAPLPESDVACGTHFTQPAGLIVGGLSFNPDLSALDADVSHFALLLVRARANSASQLCRPAVF